MCVLVPVFVSNTYNCRAIDVAVGGNKYASLSLPMNFILDGLYIELYNYMLCEGGRRCENVDAER